MNWQRTRSFFPVSDELAYLNHAGVAPISSRVEEALARYAGEASRRGAWRYGEFFDAEIERVRGRAAELLGATPEEVAFVKNTTEGLGLVATGLDWRRGDQVVTCDLEYPSNVYPWWTLADRGVETVMLRGRDGRLPLSAVEEALSSPRARLLALSSVEFGSGFRNDLDALGRLCRERGVLFCLDAIQSVGCLPTDVEASGVDFLAADGHKWLCSVEGAGLFFCSRRVIDRVTPRIVGWRSVTDNLDYDRYHTELQPGAGRFEEGTPNTAGIFALGAAIDLLLEIGVEAIAQRVLALTDRLVEGLEARGAHLLSPREPGEASGIVSFQLGGEAPKRTAARLRAAGVFVVVRRGGVRASPHFYNDESDIDRLLDAL
ncbi:MAG: aminotransferase class V-fold PLP-dependent enzyme [Myxococcota bacterium]|nr:aminotransferase class V-fold PLP-dependent enzyme [Myxococcota bacterium]